MATKIKYKIVESTRGSGDKFYNVYARRRWLSGWPQRLSSWYGLNMYGDKHKFTWDFRFFTREQALEAIDRHHQDYLKKVGDKVISRTTEYIIK